MLRAHRNGDGTTNTDRNLWNKLVYGSFFPIFNVAVGGNMGGNEFPDKTTASGPSVGIEVDYFAVYRSI